MVGDTESHHERAVDALAARRYERAGDAYTRAGWSHLADPGHDQEPFSDDPKGWVGRGLQSLAVATVAYRVADHPNRGTHRAVEGVSIARDLQDVLSHPAQTACLLEFVADFKLVGGLDGAGKAYRKAEQAYRAAGDQTDSPQTWGTTPLFEAATAVIQQVARGSANGEIAVTWQDLHGSDPSQAGAFLAHRAEYKRTRFPSMLDQTLNTGHLAAPRGTTAYGNDHYVCPECDSHDVNWTGDAVLCLRCSREMEQV